MGMNERILVILVLVAALGLSLYDVTTLLPLRRVNWQTIGNVILSFGTVLLAIWVYTDNEHREEELGILEARLNMLAKKAEQEPATAGDKT
jgi:hypothetical protein